MMKQTANDDLNIAAGIDGGRELGFRWKSLAQMERDYITAVIDWCGGNVPRAAKILNVSPSTIYRKRQSW